MTTAREVLLVTHIGRLEAVNSARQLIHDFLAAGITVRIPEDEIGPMVQSDIEQDAIAFSADAPLSPACELVVVVGGDGTILRAAEYAMPMGLPLLGVNLGHVGFLAEVESDALADVVASVVQRSYLVEERLALDVRVISEGQQVWATWALNEASIEKASRQRMIDVVLEIEGHPLSRWGCDGVVVATPTGSTAYAWSAGGPVVWPGVAALVVSPISAHALFARALVVDPKNTVAVEVQSTSAEAVLWCDGRRVHDLLPGGRVEVTANANPVRFARLHESDFTDRLVAKFHLPVEGWRGSHA